MSKPTYCIPQPQRLRRIQHSFAWIDHRLLRSGFVQIMTHQDQSLYLFLALAADRNGVSFYRKEKACHVLGLDFGEFEVARDRLTNMGLIAFQTYSALSVNGFYQLLPVDGRPPDFASATPVVAAPPSDPPVRSSRPSLASRIAAMPSTGSTGSTGSQAGSPQAGSPRARSPRAGSTSSTSSPQASLPQAASTSATDPAASPRAVPAQSPPASVSDLASRLAAAFKTI
jgi:hypothetical protein